MTDLDLNPENLFPPKPGGMVDTVRRQWAAEQEQLGALAAAPEPVKPVKLAVPVSDHGAELARARTFSIATGNGNPIAELLGQDRDRRNAVIMTLDEPIVISFSQQAADDPRNPQAGNTSLQEIHPANPGATTPLVYVLPYAASIVSASFTYTASATVATRYVDFQILDASGNVVAQVQANSGTPASEYVAPFLSANSYVSQATQYNSYAPLPVTGVLPAGYQIQITAAGGMSTGDTITGIRFLLQPAATPGTSANGFVLPVNVPITVNYQGVIYAVATSASASRVSVMAFSYAEDAA